MPKVSRAPAGEGPQGPVVLDTRKLPGRSRPPPRRSQSEGLRPDRACRSRNTLARRTRIARRGCEVARADDVDHEHAAAALREAHPGPRLRGAQAHHTDPTVWDNFDPAPHAVQPRSGRSARRTEGQRADGHTAPNFKVAKFDSEKGATRSCASSNGRSTRSGLIRATARRSSCR